MREMGAKTLFSHTMRIAWKDLTELFRNRLGLVLLIVMPLFMMVMVGFIYPSNGSSGNSLTVGIVNEDSGYNNFTLPSQTFIMGLQQINDQTHYLAFSNVTTMADIKDMVQKGDLEGGIVIPSNFSESIMTGQQGTVIIITDNSNLQISAEISGYAQVYVEQLSTVLAQTNVVNLNSSINQTNALAVVKPYNIQLQGVISGSTNYFDFVAQESWP